MSIPLWALVHLPIIVTLTTAAFTEKGLIHSLLYVLFENAMGIVKIGAAIAGALPPFFTSDIAVLDRRKLWVRNDGAAVAGALYRGRHVGLQRHQLS